ncbi:Plasma membrane t-SNARE, secretory vesicle fusion [Coemansia sp. RSA 552]|nr:Plasma membrane t-SNARE, secretory vesicle fusion [Coemansia sp. RSA 552]
MVSLTVVDPVDLGRDFDQSIASAGASFTRAIDSIKHRITSVEKGVLHIEHLHDEAIYARSRFQHIRLLKIREVYAKETQEEIVNIMTGLQTMEEAASSPNVSKNDQLIRGGRCVALGRYTRNQVDAYLRMERRQASRNRDRLTSLYKTVCPRASESSIRKAIDDGTVGEALASQIEHSRSRSEAAKVLEDVVDRQGDIANIEETVRELTRLRNEISEMINAQLAWLDVVAMHVEQVQARRPSTADSAHQKRLPWVLGVLILLIVAVTLGTTLGVLKAQGKL